MKLHSILCIILWAVGLGYPNLLIAATSTKKVDNSHELDNIVTVTMIPGLTGRLREVGSAFCGDFPGDALTLIVAKAGKTIEEHPFCSSYGKASATIVMDAHGTNYILLDFGIGRGTNAVTEYLDVFKLRKDMIEFAQIPLSQGAGPVSRWNYDYEVLAPSSGGLTLVLTLEFEADGPTWVMLPERSRIIGIDTTSTSGPIIYRSVERIF